MPPPPTRTPEPAPADESTVFKDATFAMLSHEPPLVTNDKVKARTRRGPHQVGHDRLRGPHRERLAAVRPRADDALSRPREREDAAGHHQREQRAHRPRRRPHQRSRRARRSSRRADALVALANKYNSKEWLDEQTKIVKDETRSNVRRPTRRPGRRSQVAEVPGAQTSRRCSPR